MFSARGAFSGATGLTVSRSFSFSTRDLAVLVLPGLGGSEPEHWQSRWHASFEHWKTGKEPGWTRVEQASWDSPTLEAWMGELRAAVAAAPTPPLLLCHSLGCTLAAHYLAGAERLPVAGAFLVAPPDMDAFPVLPNGEPNTFRPLALRPLGVPATVIMSASDPYTSVEAMRRHAEGWGAAPVVTTEASGHINVESGQGAWPEGRRLLAEFVDGRVRWP